MKKRKNDYQSRLREYEAECKNLQYKDLTPVEYEQEIKRLAMMYDV